MRSEKELQDVVDDTTLAIKTLAGSGAKPEDAVEMAAVCMALRWALGDDTINTTGLISAMRGLAAHIRETQNKHRRATLQ